jgi:hypothetical protein
MARAIVATADPKRWAAPISLYLDLEDGQTADLETVARAALAFSATVKEVAAFIDPFIELRVELESGTQGSLSLNSFLKNLRPMGGEELTLKAVAFVVLSWFSVHAVDWTFEKAMDAISGAEAKHFTPEQRKELSDIVQKAVAGRAAEPQAQQVYRELGADPAIKGVGATIESGRRPADIVPRSEFPARGHVSGPATPVEGGKRETVETVRVVLISPVLVPGKRRWKFRSTHGEFGASIKDEKFLEEVLTGTTSIRMKAGIEMVIQLQTMQEFHRGIWENTERNVLHVERLIEPTEPQTLFSLPDDK